jgi:hypothetical protein
MKGVNDATIAKQQAASDWRATHNNSLGPDKDGKDFQADWNKNAGPGAFVMHRMQQEHPEAFNNLVNAMRTTKEGLAALKNISTQGAWLTQHGLING